MISAYDAALAGLMRGLALEMRLTRVNLVSSGSVDTIEWREMVPDAERKTFESKATVGIGTAAEVAESYIYLMKNWNCTGSIICTDGGTLLS